MIFLLFTELCSVSVLQCTQPFAMTGSALCPPCVPVSAHANRTLLCGCWEQGVQWLGRAIQQGRATTMMVCDCGLDMPGLDDLSGLSSLTDSIILFLVPSKKLISSTFAHKPSANDSYLGLQSVVAQLYFLFQL